MINKIRLIRLLSQRLTFSENVLKVLKGASLRCYLAPRLQVGANRAKSVETD
jgi:hypothetical protein